MRRTCTVVKEFHFCAAHHLPLHDGLCKQNHGHNFLLKVGVRGAIQENGSPQDGMVVEFSHLSGIVDKLILQVLDHGEINTILETQPTWNAALSPTTENVAWWMFQVIEEALQRVGYDANVEFIKLWETPKNMAMVTRADWTDALLASESGGSQNEDDVA